MESDQVLKTYLYARSSERHHKKRFTAIACNTHLIQLSLHLVNVYFLAVVVAFDISVPHEEATMTWKFFLEI